MRSYFPTIDEQQGLSLKFASQFPHKPVITPEAQVALALRYINSNYNPDSLSNGVQALDYHTFHLAKSVTADNTVCPQEGLCFNIYYYMQAALRFYINHLTVTQKLTSATLPDTPPLKGYPGKLGIMANMLYSIENYGIAAKDIEPLQQYLRQYLKNASGLCDDSEHQCQAVGKAVLILAITSTTYTQSSTNAKAIYKMLKKSYKQDYGGIALISATAALMAMDTTESYGYLTDFLLNDSVPTGTIGNMLKSNFNSLLNLITLTYWVQLGIDGINNIRGGGGRFNNSITERYQYLDIDAAKSLGHTNWRIENFVNNVPGFAKYQIPYRNLFEDIGIMISSADTPQARKLTQVLLGQYTAAKSKVQYCKGNSRLMPGQYLITSCVEADLVNMPLIVGLLSGANAFGAAAQTAAQNINKLDWWDLNEGTQHRINNLPTTNPNFNGLTTVEQDPAKNKRSADNDKIKDIAYWGDLAISAAFIGALVYSLPAIIKNTATFATNIAKNKTLIKKLNMPQAAPVVQPIAAKILKPVSKPTPIAKANIDIVSPSQPVLPAKADLPFALSQAKTKFEYMLVEKNTTRVQRTDLTAVVGGNGGGGVFSASGVANSSGTATHITPSVLTKVRETTKPRYQVIPTLAPKPIKAMPKMPHKNSGWRYHWLNMRIGASVLKEELKYALNPKLYAAILPAIGTGLEAGGATTMAIYASAGPNILIPMYKMPTAIITPLKAASASVITTAPAIAQGAAATSKIGALPLLGFISLPRLNMILPGASASSSGAASYRPKNLGIQNTMTAGKMRGNESSAVLSSTFVIKSPATARLSASIVSKKGAIKTMYLLGGTNGSGKSTIANKVFAQHSIEFIDPDAMVAAISQVENLSKDVHAWKEVIHKLNNIVTSGETFAIETTMGSANMYLRAVQNARAAGYQVVMIYLYLDNPQLSIERIKGRVAKGGHTIPDNIVKQRFARTKNNFWNEFKNNADEWYIFYNGGKDFVSVAEGTGQNYEILNAKLFNVFMKEVQVK